MDRRARYGIEWDPPVPGHEVRYPYYEPERAEAEAEAAKRNAPRLFADRSYKIVEEGRIFVPASDKTNTGG